MSSLNIALRIDAALSGNFDRTFERINRQVRSLSEMGNQLQRQHLGMGQALQSAGLRNTENLSRLRDRYREVESAINRVTSAQNNLNRAMRFNENNQRRLGNARSEFANASISAGVGLYGASKVMQAYMEQEDASTDLKISMMDRKGLVGQFQALNKEVIFLGNQLPGTTTDFYRLAQALKEQGISDNKLVNGGLRTSAYLNTLLNMDQETGGAFFAKLIEAHGLGEQDFGKGADIVQRAKFAFGLSKDNMYESMKYYSPNVNMLGLRGTDNMQKLFAVQGMGAQVGLEGSSFGTNFAMMLTRMAKGPDMVMMAKKGMKAEARDMLEGSGVSFDFWDKQGNFAGVDNMIKQMEKLNVIKQKYGEKGALEVADAVFGAEAGRPAMIIAQKGWAGYQKNLELMQQQADMAQRIAIKTATLSNAWDAAKGTFVNFLASVGEQFAPELKNLANSANDWIANSLTPWVVKHKESIVLTGKLVAGLLGMRLAVAGLRLGFALLLSPIGKAWVMLAKLRGAMVLFSALRLSGIRRVASALQALGMSGAMAGRLASGLGKVGAWFARLPSLLARLPSLLGLVRGLFLSLARTLLFTPWGLALAGLITAGILVYKYWKPIKGFFIGFWRGLKATATSAIRSLITNLKSFGKAVWQAALRVPILGSALRTLASLARPVWNAIVNGAKQAYNWFKNLLKPVDDVGNRAQNMGERVGQALGKIVTKLMTLPAQFMRAGVAMMDGLMAGIRSKIGAVESTISSMASSISSKFKGLMQINSPSKLFMKFGRGIAEGTAVGINNGTSTAVKASGEMANKIANTEYKKAYGKYTAHADSHAGGGHQIHYNPQITVQGNASQDDIKQALNHNQREFERMLDRAMAGKNRRAYA